jgi:hypothetical protein
VLLKQRFELLRKKLSQRWRLREKTFKRRQLAKLKQSLSVVGKRKKSLKQRNCKRTRPSQSKLKLLTMCQQSKQPRKNLNLRPHLHRLDSRVRIARSKSLLLD